jgi:transcriptional regulator with XRE-family HTH domain
MANFLRFENRLRDRRTRVGWSQEELARRSGLSRAGISAIETDRIIPSAAAALALASALECRVEDLFRLCSEPRGGRLGLSAAT